jgi:hypothetical protein
MSKLGTQTEVASLNGDIHKLTRFLPSGKGRRPDE